MLRIKLAKSLIGSVPKNVATARALGLGKVGSVALHNDTPQIRGMVHQVKHLVTVEEAEGPSPASPRIPPHRKKGKE